MSMRASRGPVSAPAPVAAPSVVPTVPVTGALISAGRREDVRIERVVPGGLYLRTSAEKPRLLGPVVRLEVTRGTPRPWSAVGRLADVTGGALFLAIDAGSGRTVGRPVSGLVLATAHPFVLGEQADLVADGFGRPAVRHLLEGRVVEDASAYAAVLDLRARTLRGTGRRVLDAAPEAHAVAHECESPSRVLAWWHGPRCVASLALDLPDDEPDTVHVRRLCIDPAYRDSDCVRRLFEDVHAVLVTSGRRHVAIEAPPWLRRAYAFLGFAPTGRVRTAPEDDALLLVEMRTTQHRWGTYGLHTDPLRWNLFLRDVTDALRERGLVPTPALGGAALALYRGFRPLADRIERRLASGWRPS